MPLHLTKVAFGCTSLSVLEARLAQRPGETRLTTRYRPKRVDEIVSGSLYWIIGHRLVARSPILAFEDADAGRTNIVVESRCIHVVPRPRRAHQGWRYLEQADAPADLGEAEDGADSLPESLKHDLALLGLL
jgi:hypothetical protein